MEALRPQSHQNTPRKPRRLHKRQQAAQLAAAVRFQARIYRLIVLRDLTADPDQEVHDFLLERIFPRQAEVISSADVNDLLQ